MQRDKLIIEIKNYLISELDSNIKIETIIILDKFGLFF